MTKKDYELIAKAIRASRYDIRNTQEDKQTIDAVADALAYYLKIDNPRFDRNKFMQAITES